MVALDRCDPRWVKLAELAESDLLRLKRFNTLRGRPKLLTTTACPRPFLLEERRPLGDLALP